MSSVSRSISIRVTSVILHPLFWWGLAFATVLLTVAVVTSLDRFTEWDEAVFYSQSGGFKGTQPPPMPLAASREGGPGFLIALVRVSGVGLVGVRLAWVILALGLVAIAYWRLGKRFRAFTAEISFVAFGLSWLSLAYLGSLYGSMFAGIFLLLAAVLLLDLVESEPRSSRSFGLAALFGLSVAAAFWMRHVESLIGLAVLFVFSLAVSSAAVWRRHLLAVIAAGATFVAAFLIPWIGWSIREFGSVAGRFDSLRTQVDGNPPLQVTNGLPGYVDAMSGKLRTYGMFALVPDWPVLVLVAGLVLVIAAVAMTIWKGEVSRAALRGIVILVALASALAVFFVFYYASVEIRERYLTTILPFFAALAGVGISGVIGIFERRRSRVAIASAIALIAGIWFVAQLAIAVPFQQARVIEANSTVLTSDAVRVIAEGEACFGASRYGRAQLQLGTGCSVRGVYSVEAAAEMAREFEVRGSPAFLVWPTELDLGFDWYAMDRSGPAGSAVLHVLILGK